MEAIIVLNSSDKLKALSHVIQILSKYFKDTRKLKINQTFFNITKYVSQLSVKLLIE